MAEGMVTDPVEEEFMIPGCPGALSMLLANTSDRFFSQEAFANFSCEIADQVTYDALKEPRFKIPVIILYAIVILLGGLGNTFVVITVLKTKAMWTPTNIFIANLAVADIFVCVLDLPLSAYYQITDDWIFGAALCHVIHTLFGTVVYSSTLTLTMIAIDRYMLILFPLSKRITLPVALLLLILITAISVAVASPIAIYSEYVVYNDPLFNMHGTYCIERWPTVRLRRVYTISTLILQYFLPLLIITILYTRIFRRISRRMSHNHSSRRTKTTKMLVAVVTVFAIAWTPFHIHSLLLEFNAHFVPSRYYKFADAIFRVIALSSSCINPLLYGWLNDNFRTAFLSLIKRPTAVPTGIHREDDSLSSKKTLLVTTSSPVRKLYSKVLAGAGKGEGNGYLGNNNSCAPSCCSSIGSPETVHLQTMVMERNGKAIVVKASPQPVAIDSPSDEQPPQKLSYNEVV